MYAVYMSVDSIRGSGRPAPGRPAARGGIVRWFAVVVVSVHALAILVQPIAAGGYLNGHPNALDVHRTVASAVMALALLSIVVVSIAAIRGRWGTGPIALVVTMFLVEGLQTGMGYAAQLAVHIPLGVAAVVFAHTAAVVVVRRATGRGARDSRSARRAGSPSGGTR